MELIKQMSGQTDVPLSISGEIEPLRILLKVVLPLALPEAANASQGTRAVPLPVLPLALIRQSETGVMHGAEAVRTTILPLAIILFAIGKCECPHVVVHAMRASREYEMLLLFRKRKNARSSAIADAALEVCIPGPWNMEEILGTDAKSQITTDLRIRTTMPTTMQIVEQQLNAGTRTFAQPDGVGTVLGEFECHRHTDFTCDLCDRVFDTGREFLVDNTAPSGRYPKMWDMPRMRRLREHTGSLTVPVAHSSTA